MSHSEPTDNDMQFLFHRKYKYVCSRNLFDNFDKLTTSLKNWLFRVEFEKKIYNKSEPYSFTTLFLFFKIE